MTTPTPPTDALPKLAARLRAHAKFRDKYADRPKDFKGNPDPSAMMMIEAADEIDHLTTRLAEAETVIAQTSELIIKGWSFTAYHPRGSFYATKPGYQFFSPGAHIPAVDGMPFSDVIRAAAEAAALASNQEKK